MITGEDVNTVEITPSASNGSITTPARPSSANGTPTARVTSAGQDGKRSFQWKIPRPAMNKLAAPLPDYIRMKIISIGGAGVGKSCLIKRYCEERFVNKYISTIGVDYGVKQINIDGREIKVDFWDLAGGADYLEVRNEFYKDTLGVCLVFDVNSRRSFEQLESLLREAERYGCENPAIIIFANKIDMKKRVVSDKDGREWAASKGFPYFETSASTFTGVKDAFECLFRLVLQGVHEKD
ncbi:putative ras family GTPase [Planoprotostelium fungivorum]|uniref:Putative ras family GTPase n=1 Tax=Planoprotostelium fungivorum TaxID=1890364 RepID=A0A2P6N951_9EUKA|nr:putative ras family GTPase [Planoprotostelium fungivorum]